MAMAYPPTGPGMIGDTDFDSEMEESWYFHDITRDEANLILKNEGVPGTFLVRDSRGPDEYVLSVKEEDDDKVAHYQIPKHDFKIGNIEFPDIPQLLEFYKRHYLNTTPLIRPARKTKLYCRHAFTARNDQELTIKPGETLEFIRVDRKGWCKAKRDDEIGFVPTSRSQIMDPPPIYPPTLRQVRLPAKAIVVLERRPSLYQPHLLRLIPGQELTVLKMNPNATWEGEINGFCGGFAFEYIRFKTAEDN